MNKDFKRQIGFFSLMLTGLGSIIGSGWLFGAWRAAKIAGPASIVAWIIGAAVILVIALTYAELGALFPESGGMVRYAHISHGPLAGFIGAWANWIAIVSVIPIEAEASIQYMSSWPWEWSQNLYLDGSLQLSGLLLSGVLVVVYFFLNYWGIKVFMRANFAITLFKFFIPTITAIALVLTGVHTDNFSLNSMEGFVPYGWSAVFTAVATSGIVMSFNGFQSPVNLAGEARNPSRNVPLAIACSIFVSLFLYLFLQISYIGAINPTDVQKGWNLIDFSSPFAELAIALNLNWLAMMLYVDAFVSPSGTGIIYMATTTRMIYAMERNRSLPKIFGQIHPLYGVPRAAMWFNLGVAFLFMFFFRGWSALATVISVMTIISYITGPISLMALRRTANHINWPLRLPGMSILAPLAFVFASLILYWACWPLAGKIILLIIIVLPFYLWYQMKINATEKVNLEVKSALWLLTYLPVMAALSYIGSEQFGGIGLLSFGWDMVVVGAFALAFYFWGIHSGSKFQHPEAFARQKQVASTATAPATSA